MDVFTKANRLYRQAHDFGFTWLDAEMICSQIISECLEIREAIDANPEHIQEEVGDLFHAVFSLCAYLGYDAEQTFSQSVDKFNNRFIALKGITQEKGHKTLHGQSIESLLQFWKEAKKRADT